MILWNGIDDYVKNNIHPSCIDTEWFDVTYNGNSNFSKLLHYYFIVTCQYGIRGILYPIPDASYGQCHYCKNMYTKLIRDIDTIYGFICPHCGHSLKTQKEYGMGMIHDLKLKNITWGSHSIVNLKSIWYCESKDEIYIDYTI